MPIHKLGGNVANTNSEVDISATAAMPLTITKNFQLKNKTGLSSVINSD